MEHKYYEEEYSLFEIAKYNLKHWVILLVCALAVGVLAGAYGYKNTKPSVVYYEELKQVNGAFYVSQYNTSGTSERMYDVQQIAKSNGAYQVFLQETGYEMTYNEYKQMFGYSNEVITNVMNLYVAYPEQYGEVSIETESEALAFMKQLLDSQKKVYDAYVGKDAVTILSEPYVTSYTQAAANTATTKKDLLNSTIKGGMAGIFLGLLLGIAVVSIVYLFGTVAKTAKEIEQKLKAPVIAFVHKNDRAEQFKKAYLFLEKQDVEYQSIVYVPFDAQNADGALELAKTYASMNRKTLLIDLAKDAEAHDAGFSQYLFGLASKNAVQEEMEGDISVIRRKVSSEEKQELMSSRVLKPFIKEKAAQYECVIINAPDLKHSSDAYGVALTGEKVLFGCKRREVTGTDLYEIEKTMENNEIHIDGVILYGN